VEVKALLATGANAWADAKRTADRIAVLAIILFVENFVYLIVQ